MSDEKTDDEAAAADDAAADELEWGTTSFEPGPDVGLVARRTIGLVEQDNPSTRATLWDLVADDAPLDDILDELSSTGLKALPDFGLVQVEGTNVRVVARGRTRVTAELASGSIHEVDASRVRTWIEEVISDVVTLTLSLPARGGDDAGRFGAEESFAVLAGSVPVSSLTRRYDEPDAHSAIAARSWTTNVGSDRSGADDGDNTEDPEYADAEHADTGDDDNEGAEPEFAPAPGVDLAQTGDVSTASGAALPQGATRLQPAVETAGVEATGLLTTSSDTLSPDPAAPVPPDAPPSDPQPPAPTVTGLSGDDQPPPSGPAPGSMSGGAPPDSTVIAGRNIAGREVAGHDDAVGSAFDVEADLATTLADDDSSASLEATHGQPVVGVLAFSNGERVDVDRAVVIGRNPKVGDRKGEPPRIVKFDGPGQGLSRTHAEVRIEDGRLVVEDLRSTNGTDVQLPGEQRRTLGPDESVVVVPGSLIDFGEELQCTVESGR